MSTLAIVYAALLVPGLLWMLASVLGADIDVDGLDLPGAGFGWLVSAALLFCAGFGAGGLIGLPVGRSWSVVLGLVFGLSFLFLFRRLLRLIAKFCKGQENSMPDVEVGDRAVALGEIRPGLVGKVAIPAKQDGSGRGVTRFAMSSGLIPDGGACVVAKLEGGTVEVKPESNTGGENARS